MTDTAKPTLMVIDGHSLAFRAFYALPLDSFQTKDGVHTNAIHGFLSMLLSLLQKEKPTHLAVAFDISRYSFRTREYPEYKGTRGDTPEEFKGQIPLLEEALAAMGVPTLSKEDYEADDILATLATRGVAEGYKVLLVSGDRDTIQLVNGEVTLLYPSARGVSELKRYDREAVIERYGVAPEQYPDVAALVGETSDNLIGIDKVGEKTAVKWVQLYGDLAGILEHQDEIKGVVGANLRAQRERAVLNRRLNHLVTDVDLPVSLDGLARRPIDAAAVRTTFDRLQFRTLQDRVLKLAGEAPAEATTDSADPGIPAVKHLVDEELAHWLSRSSGPVAVVIAEHDGALTRFGLATADDSVRVEWGPHRPDYEALEAWLAGPSPKLLHDSKRAHQVLGAQRIALDGVTMDTTLAGVLLRPGSKREDLVGQVYLQLGERMPAPDPNQLVPEGAELDPGTQAWYLFRLAERMRELLPEGSARVLETIELPLVPVVVEMEQNGITVDRTVLTELSSTLGTRAAEIADRAYAIIGHEVNLGSPKQLQQVLFEELGMPRTRATKTGYSTDASALSDLQDQLPEPHPFLERLLEHRDATKLRQIVDTLVKAIGDDGRIHTTYDQVGAATGRMSSTDPNLQNIPVRTAEGAIIRGAFRAGDGFEALLTADYSQIEMRIMAHLSGDEGLIEAFTAGEDLHRFVGARIFGVDPDEVTPAMRTKVKAMSYGLVYGLSAYGLSKQLRIEVSEAKQLMTDYFARFGAVRSYLQGVVQEAKQRGYTETIFGRRRPFGDITSNNRVLREAAERAALNAPIQGSAADLMKIAMLHVADGLAAQGLGSRMLLQVHDELVFEVAPGELDAVTALVTDAMSQAADLDVPLEVQIGTGPDWNAAAH